MESDNIKDFHNLATNIITETSYFNVARSYKQEFSARIFGGGTYDHGADYYNDATYGGGGSFSDKAKNGASGICIIQYYAP